MDPQETLKLLLLAVVNKKSHAATEHFWNLHEWLQKDGAVPDLKKAFEEVGGD